jgi:hypothetical protein
VAGSRRMVDIPWNPAFSFFINFFLRYIGIEISGLLGYYYLIQLKKRKSMWEEECG